ncbi:MAG: ribosome silencing factor [Prolixibacteraceae bacterium]|jgi:ribosome-associated protein|nr:ribosome silencing factor [Prolixibacteraceae bacterium]MDD4754887.1 ribosome silencing factor [Prolixibacteraceae bacterium]NLO03895.1 ribosome silencing factor [Bacteroidales bacterium]
MNGKEEINNLKEAILEGIKKIKGKEIIIIDLNTIKHTECGFFIICHGTSVTQVSSIGRSVEETVEKMTNLKAWHSEGYNNSLWILLDYGDIVVHVFHERTRHFYNLEGLWADAKSIIINSEI